MKKGAPENQCALRTLRVFVVVNAFAPFVLLEREVEAELQNPRLVGRRLIDGGQTKLRRIAERRRIRPVVGMVEDVEHFRHQVGVAPAAK